MIHNDDVLILLKWGFEISDFTFKGVLAYINDFQITSLISCYVITISYSPYFWVVNAHKAFCRSSRKFFCPFIPVLNLVLLSDSRNGNYVTFFPDCFPICRSTWSPFTTDDTFATLCHHFQFYKILNSHPLYNTILIMWFL